MVDLEQLYSRAYYLSDCEGFSEFHKTWGRKPSRRLAKCIELLGPGRGQRIVDLGCGRGEVALNAAVRGAQVVNGGLTKLAAQGQALKACPVSRVLAPLSSVEPLPKTGTFT